MDALFANPFTYVGGVIGLLVLLIGLAVYLERADRRRYQRILADGDPAEATVLSAGDTGWRTNGRPHIRFALEVRRPGYPPYRAETRLTIARPWSALPYGPGSVVRVRVDPADPRRVAIVQPGQAEVGWLGPPPAASGGHPVEGPDRAADRLRALQQLRDEGLISAEEYASKRAEILGEL